MVTVELSFRTNIPLPPLVEAGGIQTKQDAIRFVVQQCLKPHGEVLITSEELQGLWGRHGMESHDVFSEIETLVSFYEDEYTQAVLLLEVLIGPLKDQISRDTTRAIAQAISERVDELSVENEAQLHQHYPLLQAILDLAPDEEAEVSIDEEGEDPVVHVKIPQLGMRTPLYLSIQCVVETTLAVCIDLIETVLYTGKNLLQNAKALTVGNVKCAIWALNSGVLRPGEESLYHTDEKLDAWIDRQIEVLNGWKGAAHLFVDRRFGVSDIDPRQWTPASLYA